MEIVQMLLEVISIVINTKRINNNKEIRWLVVVMMWLAEIVMCEKGCPRKVMLYFPGVLIKVQGIKKITKRSSNCLENKAMG